MTAETFTEADWRKPSMLRKEIMQQDPLPKEWFEKSDRYGIWVTFKILAPLFACFATAPWLWLHVSPWTALPLAVLIGIYGYKISFIMHDCSHDALFRERRMNDIVGSLCGWIVCSEYFRFKRLHQGHHSHNGSNEDPQHDDYCGFKDASKKRLLWHLGNALVLGRVPSYLYMYLGNLGRKGAIAPAPVVEGEGFSIGWAVKTGLMQIFILALVTGFGSVPVLALLYPLSAASFALFFARLRTVAEHIEPPQGTFQDFTRTHMPNALDAFCLYDAHFNYHLEHHIFPHLPSHALPKFHEKYKERIHTPLSLRRSMFTTLKDRIKSAP